MENRLKKQKIWRLVEKNILFGILSQYRLYALTESGYCRPKINCSI